VVAESLANAAKHSGADRVGVRVWRTTDERLVVECTDDGTGGADLEKGSGLSGLAKRVAALDGRLIVESPPGGPTTIRAEIPCG
jgi:signal transduction histidine kinase